MPGALERALLIATFCVAALLSAEGAFADTTTATVVPACGNGNNGKPLQIGTTYSLSVDPNGTLCTISGNAGAPTHVTIDGPDGPEGGVSVSINPFRQDATNHSGAITVGGSWVQVFAANPLRQRIFAQNYCSAQVQGIAASESLFLAVSPVMPDSPLTTPGPAELVTCGSYDSSSAVVGTSPVWLWAATTGHRFSALEW